MTSATAQPPLILNVADDTIHDDDGDDDFGMLTAPMVLAIAIAVVFMCGFALMMGVCTCLMPPRARRPARTGRSRRRGSGADRRRGAYRQAAEEDDEDLLMEETMEEAAAARARMLRS